jgi:hypothetical protein
VCTDLVLGHEPCYRRLAQFLRISPEEVNAKIYKTIEANRGHESSYLGNKWSSELKERVEASMAHNKHVLDDFDFWGYQVDNYKLTKDCESLPWMDAIRKAKGPLPGDLPNGAKYTSAPTPKKFR